MAGRSPLVARAQNRARTKSRAQNRAHKIARTQNIQEYPRISKNIRARDSLVCTARRRPDFVFLLRHDALDLRCFSAPSSIHFFLVRVIALPFFFCLLFVSTAYWSKLLKKASALDPKKYRYKNARNYMLNSMGTICLSLYMFIASTSLAPFKCYTHPSGHASLVAYPSVLCGEEGDHVGITALGVCMMLVCAIP